ncbi:unnamed protein product [Rotaria socialis]|uniref:TIL domain-containing protein n=1 Tax=Rotaria socialis TaxID=392032 RepID=A0A820Y673_9BILA|nr:unnamed protein product [Rotaria socialis]CAF3385957.1 unnamed protein product [Rotaria socialis]CAF3503174.1 unnamed protein product [Rotaria socialis]CAF3682974.1 unnamed protein product [Rotaria socialis]CAF3750743.1 unnamed protein product [Rotaria socialis]
MASILNVCIRLLLAIIVATQSLAVNQCGENEQYGCGSVCVETCDYKPQICILMCRFGCSCKEGYVRESNDTGSRCIKREECKPIDVHNCGENEEFRTCGSACPPTCNDWSYPIPKPVKICPKICVESCFCKNGLYRANDGRCVKREECCSKNELFMECGIACPETCNDRPKICTEQCVAGCFCRNSDYLRINNSTASSCVRRNECPK